MPDAIVDYAQKVFNLDEYRTRAIVQMFRDQWQYDPALFGGETQPSSEPEQERPPAREVDPWIKALSIWNYATDPVWIFLMTTGAAGYMGLRGLGAATASLPLRAALPTLRPAIPFGGVPTRQLIAATKNPFHAENLANWYAGGRIGKMPSITPTEMRIFNIQSTPYGQQMLQRATKLGFTEPSKAAAHLTETQMRLAEKNPAMKAIYNNWLNSGADPSKMPHPLTGPAPPRPTTPKLPSPSQTQQWPGQQARTGQGIDPNLQTRVNIPGQGSQPPSGLKRNNYGTSDPGPWWNPVQNYINKIRAEQLMPRLQGTGVGGTSLTQAEMLASGLRPTTGQELTGTYWAKMSPSLYSLGERFFTSTGKPAIGQGLTHVGGQTAYSALPLILYMGAQHTIKTMQENLNSNIRTPTEQFKWDPMAAAYEQAGKRAEGAVMPEPVLQDPRRNPITYPTNTGPYEQLIQSMPSTARYAYGLAEGAGQWLTQELPKFYTGIQQTIPQGWNPETLRAMSTGAYYGGQYIPGGALAASAWGSTPQSSGLSPGGWIAQRKAGGSSGQWGG